VKNCRGRPITSRVYVLYHCRLYCLIWCFTYLFTCLEQIVIINYVCTGNWRDRPSFLWCSISQGSCGSLKVVEFFFQIFKAWKVLENRHGPWKSLNLCLKVLESAWIRFSSRRLLMPWNIPRTRCRPGLRPWPCWSSSQRSPRPANRLRRGTPPPQEPHSSRRLDSRAFAYISFVWSLKVLEKSLNLILTNGQEPCLA